MRINKDAKRAVYIAPLHYTVYYHKSIPARYRRYMMPGWATVAAFIEGVNELELRNIPLLAEEGNVATLIRCCKASFVGADGVVSSAKCSGLRFRRSGHPGCAE